MTYDEVERLARLMAAREGDPDKLVYRGELERCDVGYVLPKANDPRIVPYWTRFLGAAQAVCADTRKRERAGLE